MTKTLSEGRFALPSPDHTTTLKSENWCTVGGKSTRKVDGCCNGLADLDKGVANDDSTCTGCDGCIDAPTRKNLCENQTQLSLNGIPRQSDVGGSFALLFEMSLWKMRET